MRNILASIARGIRAGLRAAYFGARTAVDEILDLIASPMRAFGGSGPDIPAASFHPDVDPGKLLDTLGNTTVKASAKNAASKDATDTLAKYLSAAPTSRATIDLSALRHDVRMTLLDLADAEINALKQAGGRALRAFSAGNRHGVHGVPEVGSIKPVPCPKEQRTPYDLLIRRIQRNLRETQPVAHETAQPFPAKI